MLWRKAERGEIKDKIVHEYNKKHLNGINMAFRAQLNMINEVNTTRK